MKDSLAASFLEVDTGNLKRWRTLFLPWSSRMQQMPESGMMKKNGGAGIGLQIFDSQQR